MKLEFTAQDFRHEKFAMLSPLAQEALSTYAQYCAMVANRRIAEMLSNAPVVYSGPEKAFGTVREEWALAELEGEDTHRALLVNVKPIEPERDAAFYDSISGVKA